MPVRTYSTADGLLRDQVNRIKRDSRGFLWFCTNDGLSRFDGYGFTNYTTDDGLPHRVVNDLLETRGGEIWVATGNGLARFNPKGLRNPADSIRATAAPMFVAYWQLCERSAPSDHASLLFPCLLCADTSIHIRENALTH